MDFETWWASFWKRSGQPEVFDLAFKEIAQKAWDAGNIEGYSDGRADGIAEAQNDFL